jgi:hypothetical protein
MEMGQQRERRYEFGLLVREREFRERQFQVFDGLKAGHQGGATVGIGVVPIHVSDLQVEHFG